MRVVFVLQELKTKDDDVLSSLRCQRRACRSLVIRRETASGGDEKSSIHKNLGVCLAEKDNI